MTGGAIFAYGIVVSAIVAAACWLIVWGIIQERRDREALETEQAAEREIPRGAP